MEKHNNKIFNLNGIRLLMTSKPPVQRLYKAFDGEWDVLTDAQILEVEMVVRREYDNLMENIAYIRKQHEI